MTLRIAASFLIAALATAAPLAAETAAPAKNSTTEKAIAPAGESSHIDLVLCLDTSSSMDGLIESAKVKLWDVVNTLATAQPTPDLRVALYSYGNDGIPADAGWVRQELALTDDLDSVNEKLFALRTGGGTELVARVTKTALEKESWTRGPGKTMRLIFVCGNEPANQDETVSLDKAMSAAQEKTVTVNTIYCGNPDDDAAASWRQAAGLAKGKFASIDMNNTVAIATPFDDEMAKLSTQLNGTYIAYGRNAAPASMRQLAQDSNASSAGGAVAASRAVAKSSSMYKNASWDLVDAKAEKAVKLDEVSAESLPEEMKALKPAEREAYVDKKAKEREAVQAKIKELAAKREAFLTAERAKQAGGKGTSLDKALVDALSEQATAAGIEIKGK